MNFLRKAKAFLKRNFITEKNYRLAFFISIFNIFSAIALFYFITRLFDQKQNLYLERFKGNFFTFLLIGLAFSRFIYAWLSCFANSLQNEFYNGSLEIMLTTPTSIFEILFFSVLWNQVYALIQVLLYLFVGVFIFKAHIITKGYLLALVITLASMPVFTGLGILYASLLMFFKRGEALITALIFMLTFFGGVYFPIEVFPQGLQRISYFLPITNSLRAIREVLINGQTINFIYKDLIVLVISSIIIFPFSLFIFQKTFKKAKANGSLTHY